MEAVADATTLPSSAKTSRRSGSRCRSGMVAARCWRRLFGLYMVGGSHGVVGVDTGVQLAGGVVAVAGNGVKSCRSRWVKFGARLVPIACGSGGISSGGALVAGNGD